MRLTWETNALALPPPRRSAKSATARACPKSTMRMQSKTVLCSDVTRSPCTMTDSSSATTCHRTVFEFALRFDRVVATWIAPSLSYDTGRPNATYWSGLSKPEKMLHVMRTAQSIHPDWVFCHESAAVALAYMPRAGRTTSPRSTCRRRILRVRSQDEIAHIRMRSARRKSWAISTSLAFIAHHRHPHPCNFVPSSQKTNNLTA